jgi:diaminopimelate epimerase
VKFQKISFHKFSASANDFIILDNRKGGYSEDASRLAHIICKRRYSVGADGLILIENSDHASVRVRFFNPDGNEFNTCGNGGRAAARYVSLLSIAPSKMTIETNVGVVDAEVLGETVRLKFVAPKKIELNIAVDLNGETVRGHYVNVGEPHFIHSVQNIRQMNFVPVARRLRYHDAFAPEGANVHFIEHSGRQLLKIRSYERGVEDETLACGSGCVSSAISTFANGDTDPPVTFEPQSGIPVAVRFDPKNNFQDLYLEGDARMVYSGELTPEGWSGFPVD